MLLSIPAARAADLPMLPPPPIQVPVVREFSGWYLRGDVGMTNQQLGSLWQRTDVNAISLQPTGMGFDSSPFFGLGVGYQVNNWLRFDVTGEYRAKATFHGTDNATFNDGFGVAAFTDTYNASKSEWVVLANGYIDLGTWWCITPFVGAGVGMARNTISSFQDTGIGHFSQAWAISTGLDPKINAVTFAPEASKWNFAWAAHAGLAYKVTPGVTLEFAYRYLDLGKATTGATYAFDNSFTNGGPFEFRNLTSHDFKLGVRFMLGEPEPAPMMMPPLMRKG